MRVGWFKFHRQIFDNPICTKDAEHFFVWCYLLTEAQHEDKVPVGGVHLDAGENACGNKGNVLGDRESESAEYEHAEYHCKAVFLIVLQEFNNRFKSFHYFPVRPR